jgi:hypothetical protein
MIHPGLSIASHGDKAAAMAAVQVARHSNLNSLAMLATKDRSLHVWQTSVCAFRSLNIASPVV